MHPSSIPLLLSPDSTHYHISPQAQHILQSFGDQPLSIISVIGKPKTGKSYILNHIASNPSAFQVNSQVNKSTKGIWMSKGLYNLDGKKVLLLDNESFNSSCNSLHDSRLFFVNMLLSSVLIYNNFGVIDEQALSHLSLIIGLGQVSQTVINNEWNVEKPHLFWLVRDFILKLESKNGDPFTSKEYLEKVLDDQKGLTSSIVQKNCVRSMIKEMFENRECETLVRPAREEKDLHCLSNIPFDELRKEFIGDIKRFKGKLGKCIKYKKVNGQVLTGNLLLKIVKACVNSFNGITCGNKSKEIPTMTGIWQMVQSEQKRQVAGRLESLCNQIKREFKEGNVGDVEGYWNEKIKQINTLNNKQIIELMKEKKQSLLFAIQESRDVIVPITFQGINLNFLQSVVNYERSSEVEFSSNKFCKKRAVGRELKESNYQQSRYVTDRNQNTHIEKQLQLTRKELSLMKQKCREFELEKQTIMKTIQVKDKHISDITSRKRDSLFLSKSEDDESSISRLLEMYQKLEEKYEKVNDMSKHTMAYICSHCKGRFEPLEFEKHVEKIKNEKVEDLSDIRVLTPISNKHTTLYPMSLSIDPILPQAPTSLHPHQPKASFFTPYLLIPPSSLSVDIQKTLIKQDHQHRNYIQYIIKVTLKNSKWTINRKYKDFCQLHDILMIMLPQLDFPDSSALIKVGMLTSVAGNGINKKGIVEERRKTLQSYLTEIIGMEEVRNTRILQKFLKVNQEYRELEYLEEQNVNGKEKESGKDRHLKSKSPFSTEMKGESRVGRSQTQYGQTRKYGQSRGK